MLGFFVLVALASATSSYSRREVVLEFHMLGPGGGGPFAASSLGSSSERNHGSSQSQTHISGVSKGNLCYTWLEDNADPAQALLEMQLAYAVNGTFTVQQGNVTFGTAGSISFGLAPGNYLYNKQAGLFYSAVALNITGGSGSFAGATGSAAYIIYAFDQFAPNFSLLFKAIVYVPGATAPLRQQARARRQSISDCVNPSFPSTVTWDSMILSFATTTVGNQNTGYASPQQYDLSPTKEFKYESIVGSPTPSTFNETGTISFDGGSFHFTSLSDGDVYNYCPDGANSCIAHGSIAYLVDKTSGSLDGAFGLMVDVFEAFPKQTSFPIHVMAVLFKLSQRPGL